MRSKGIHFKTAGLFACFGLLLVFTYLSITMGFIKLNWFDIIEAFTNFAGSNKHIVLRDIRVPRTLIGIAVGVSLGIAGTLLQALTKNPLADTGILGINSGASLLVVVGVSFFSISTLSEFMWLAFAGAAMNSCAVYILGSMGRNGMTPLKLTLAGAALAAMASSFTHGLLVINAKNLNEILFWISGSVEGRKLEMLVTVLPCMLIAWVGAFLIAGPVNILLLGDDVAKSLGQRVVLVKITTGILVLLLAGSSVAIAGPIGFIGLVVPHLSRFLSGVDLRWNVLYSGLLGALLLLASDILARYLIMPGEIPVGVVTALLGTPFFIFTARRKDVRT